MGVAAGFIFLLLMLVPVVGGVVLIVMSRKRGKGYPACGQCGYDVSGTLGTTTARCPECGGDFGVVGVLPAATRTNKPALWIGVAMVLVPLLCIGGMMISSYFAMVEARQAQRAAVVQQQAAIAAAQAAQQTPLPPAAANEILTTAPPDVSADVAMAFTSALTQSEVDGMNEAELRAALGQRSKARQYASHPAVRERLKREFEAIMERLMMLRDASRP